MVSYIIGLTIFCSFFKPSRSKEVLKSLIFVINFIVNKTGVNTNRRNMKKNKTDCFTLYQNFKQVSLHHFKISKPYAACSFNKFTLNINDKSVSHAVETSVLLSGFNW